MKSYMVFDVGGSSIKYALMDETGDILEKSSIVTPKDSIESFVELIGSITDNYKEKYDLYGVALSLPGTVNCVTGIIGGASAVKYIHGPNVKKIIEDRVKLKVEMENDANCAALAEGWIGAAKNYNDYLCVVIGSGIGGAMVLDKKIRHGKHLFTGEFGCMVMESTVENPLGSNWSVQAATYSLVKEVAKVKSVPMESIDGKEVFQLAEAGDREVLNILEEFYRKIAVGIFNLQCAIDPEIILIGGGISAREDIIDKINFYLKPLISQYAGLGVKIDKCKFENDANLIGALYHFLTFDGIFK